MQSHPVPQNIMQVEFQLVGLLTLRQFGYLAAAGILAWLIFITPIFLFVKAPFAIAAALLGLALAFLPINDMKFEKWIFAFFRAIYSPTRRVWFKEAKTIDFLTDKFDNLIARPATLHTARGSNRARLDLYLNSNRRNIKNSLDEFEQRRIESLNFAVEAPSQLAGPPTLAPDFLPIHQASIENPRIVEESPQPVNSIASKVIFTPVATIKLPDKNIFVKAVSNKRKHFLNPMSARAGTIHLPIRGEMLFKVSQNLTEKIASHAATHETAPVKPAVPEVLMAEPTPRPVTIPQFTSANLPIAPLKQAAQPQPAVPPFSAAAPQSQPKPYFQPPTTPPSVVERPIVATPPALLQEKPSVINVFVNTPTTSSSKPVETPPQNPIQPPVSVAATTVNAAPPLNTNSVTNPPIPIIINTEPAKPDPGLGVENQALKENVRRLADEQSMLEGKLERYKTQEKFLQSQLEESRSQPGTGEANRLNQLEEKLKQMQIEKEQAVQRAQKLEGLITNLNTTQPRPNREIVTPQAAETPKPAAIHVVSARRAEGKMAPPMTTVPNVINGVVKDANGLLLSDTIIVVKDKNDEPVRALKTNKVGQFAISTALPSGTYLMEVEKESYDFDYIEVKLTGEILAPIEIRSRNGGVSQ